MSPGKSPAKAKAVAASPARAPKSPGAAPGAKADTAPATTSQPEPAWDAVVVGAGVAGSAMAYKLGQEGRRVLLLERELTEPDRIVGELLQPGGYLKLKELGLAHCVDDIDAQPVLGYCLIKNGVMAKLAYPATEEGKAAAGRSFHNGRFVMQLRKAAVSQASVCLRQGSVMRLNGPGGKAWESGDVVCGVQYRDGATQEERSAEAPLTIACDGMFSVLRKELSNGTIHAPSYFVGLILENCNLPYPNHGHVVLGDPAPVLFYPISSTEVRCLVDVPGTVLPSSSTGEMSKYLREVVGPQVPEVLRKQFLCAVDNGRIRSMLNKQLAPSPVRQPGALLLGDSFNMRHPLTGGGMTVAFSDVAVLCDMLHGLPDFRNVSATQKRTDAYYVARTKPASTINTLANALYKVFSKSPDPAMEEMRQACFDYLASGGNRAAGPIALLGGLDSNPLNLVTHFFAVAVFGVSRLLPRGLGGIWTSLKVLKGACSIILPIMYAEGIGAMLFPTKAAGFKRKSDASVAAPTVKSSKKAKRQA